MREKAGEGDKPQVPRLIPGLVVEIAETRGLIICPRDILDYLCPDFGTLVIASHDRDVLLIRFSAKTCDSGVPIEIQESRAYFCLNRYGPLCTGLLPGPYSVEYGYWHGYPTVLLKNALVAPAPTDRQLGEMWLTKRYRKRGELILNTSSKQKNWSQVYVVAPLPSSCHEIRNDNHG